MSTAVSFVIPTLDEQEAIAPLLRCLRGAFPEAELIVVDGGSADETVARATGLCDQLLLGEPGRALQMNLGGSAARADYVFFLHADSRPGLDASQLDAYLARQPQWGFCRVRLSGARPVFRLIESCMNLRSRLTRVATGDQMLFLRRELLAATGGFDAIALMEDVAYCKRLRRLAQPLVIEQPVLTSSRRWEARGVVATVVRMWLLRLGFFLGVSPAALWRSYYGR
ncbi:MAG: TIGR04283 family arsenosugar biosynthesis glycosyltransferase [Halioglobus sp.]|nr:TIGR04283 family arsenosugar biosynthesis glycosyltransferase [Halioglobus sp.]